MTGTDAEGVDWGDFQAPDGRSNQDVPMPGYDDMVANARAVQYPEYGPLPEARISVNFRPGDKPQITLRASTAADFTALLNEIEEHGVYANLAAAMASLNAQGALGAGLGPVSPVGPPAAPAGPPQQQYPSGPPQPSQGPPPAWAAPPTPGYQSGPPATQGWGGQQGGSNRDPKPRPQGWAMVDVPFNDKDRWKALRAQGTQSADYLRGKVQWGGKGTYWLDPSVAGWIAQQGFPVTT